MNITIKKLTAELSADYFDFFDNRAFTDASPYRCYCQMFQLSKQQYGEEYKCAGADMGALSKNIAKRQIEAGELRGYLAYLDGVAVGWCNANDRANYPSEPYCDVLCYSPNPHQEMAVVCFEIAPEYRGMGIASALLARVIADACENGYLAVSAFPLKRSERYEWDYSGPIRLYEKAGFLPQSVHGDTVIMKLCLPPENNSN